MSVKVYSCEAIAKDIEIKNAEKIVLSENKNYDEYFSVALRIRFFPSRREKFIEVLYSEKDGIVSAEKFKKVEFRGVEEILSGEHLRRIVENIAKKLNDLLSDDLRKEEDYTRKEVERVERFLKNSIMEMEELLKEYERSAMNILSEARRVKSQLKYMAMIKKYDELREKIEKLREEIDVKRELLHEKLQNWKKMWGEVNYTVEPVAILHIKIPVIHRECVFRNDYAETSISYTLNPLEDGIKCGCGKEIKEGYLTLAGNLVCEECALNCKECEKVVSVYEDHGFCNECLAPLCPEHIHKCSSCNKNFCSEHIEKCDFCANEVCLKDLKRCEKCGKKLCPSHTYICVVCENVFCPLHIRTCAICGGDVCEKHYHRCTVCGRYVCENCATKKNGKWVCKNCSSKLI